MTYEEFASEESPRFLDSDFDLSVQSSLHPYASNATVLVRFTAVGIYAITDLDEAHPIAVLVLGDIVNGKFGVIDTSSRQFGNVGYTGIYYVDESTGQANVLTASYSATGTSGSYEYDIKSAAIEALVERSYYEEASCSDEVKLDQERMKMYVVRADLSFREDGAQKTLLPDYYPQMYFVRGVSSSKWDSLLQRELALSLSSFFIRMGTMTLTCWMLYHPIRKFTAQLDSSVVKNYRDKHKKESSSDYLPQILGKKKKNRSHIDNTNSSNRVNTRVETTIMGNSVQVVVA